MSLGPVQPREARQNTQEADVPREVLTVNGKNLYNKRQWHICCGSWYNYDNTYSAFKLSWYHICPCAYTYNQTLHDPGLIGSPRSAKVRLYRGVKCAGIQALHSAGIWSKSQGTPFSADELACFDFQRVLAAQNGGRYPRFLDPGCHVTVHYLPSFLPYDDVIVTLVDDIYFVWSSAILPGNNLARSLILFFSFCMTTLRFCFFSPLGKISLDDNISTWDKRSFMMPSITPKWPDLRNPRFRDEDHNIITLVYRSRRHHDDYFRKSTGDPSSKNSARVHLFCI